jgi:hypothetical protein
VNNASTKKDLKELVNRFNDDVNGLAECWRVDVLRPFCRKHRLTFVSGMGSYAFFGVGEKNKHVQIHDDVDAERYGMKSIIPILRMLETEVSGSDDIFGFRVSDVKESEL